MTPSCDLSIIVPTAPTRTPKLRRLLEGVARSNADREAIEVVLVVDGRDAAPLHLARETLGGRVALHGLTQAPAGPAAARNLAIQHARGAWLLSLDDDMILGETVIAAHLERIRRDRGAATAWLGPVDWPGHLLDTRWHRLLARSPMLFFPMPDGEDAPLGFRFFWSGHVSVRRDLVIAAGGFDGRFPFAMHEDIELGWRLERRFGLRVLPLRGAAAWHDHPLSPEAYLRREHRAGIAAAVAREVNQAFHDELWSRFGDARRTLRCLRENFLLAARQMAATFEGWTAPSADRESAEDQHTAYLAHLPLKRIAFLQGYVGESFEALWEEMRGAGGASGAGRFEGGENRSGPAPRKEAPGRVTSRQSPTLARSGLPSAV